MRQKGKEKTGEEGRDRILQPRRMNNINVIGKVVGEKKTKTKQRKTKRKRESILPRTEGLKQECRAN